MPGDGPVVSLARPLGDVDHVRNPVLALADIVEDLGAPAWHEDVIFDISFSRYRTRAKVPPGRDPRRYAWEGGEVCEYRLERGRPVRRTALLRISTNREAAFTSGFKSLAERSVLTQARP